MRPNGRKPDELRPPKIKRRFTRPAPGSVLIQQGRTTVLCTATVQEQTPAWMQGQGRGWVTAEYGMLPGSTSPRKPRERGGGMVDGRTIEIQRLIGRSLRAVTNLEALGECTITVDCDVLEADGGTRTASITGGFIALVDAVNARAGSSTAQPGVFRDSVAAVSVGLVAGQPLLDLDYQEDSAATVDMNVVMTGAGQFVELQGTGEEATFSEQELSALVALARRGIRRLRNAQQAALGKQWPWDK